MRPLQYVLLSHARFWWKVRRRLRRYYLSFVLAKMGKDCSICDGVLITDPEFTIMGNRVTLNEGVILLTFDSESTITIGNNVTISYGVNLIAGGLDSSGGVNRREHIMAPIVIEDNVWIAAQAVILSGVTIGHGAVIAAGSVVNRDVPPNTLVAGVPARVIKTLVQRDKK
jgi:acetyltransferase-like isoleucine patch superfamily enzyme